MCSQSHGSDKEEGGDGSGIISYEQLPVDLMEAIFWRLPAKYVVRLCCVSKNLWSSIIATPYFLNHPSNQPHLLVSLRKGNNLLITALSQHQDTPTKRFESYHMTIPEDYMISSQSTRSLVSLKVYESRIGIWNPTTRQYVILPKTKVNRIHAIGLVGYDPIEDKYKVLCVSTLCYKRDIDEEAEVLTLGDEESWRTAKGCPFHRLFCCGPCINGVIYYEAYISDGVHHTLLDKIIIMRFDVRYEKFKVMEIPQKHDDTSRHLFNYHGRLAWVSCGLSSVELCVLEDDAKQEWSCTQLLLSFPLVDPIWQLRLRLRGVVDATGELIFIANGLDRFNAFYIVYYHPKKNDVREVRFEGAAYEELTRGSNGVDIIRFFPNHIENFMSLKSISH